MAVLPIHNTTGLLVAVTVGFAFTVNVMVVVFVQPEALAPVTVYVVVTVGDTLTGVPIKPPGFQV